MKRRHLLKQAAPALALISYLLVALAVVAGTNTILAAGSSQRKALFTGPSISQRGPDGSLGHSQYGRTLFLEVVGNRTNSPAAGWTCDMSDDVILRLGLNPTNTSLETMFNAIGRQHLGYRIAMNNGPMGQTAAYWGCAVDNGIMPFAPHYNNNPGLRFDDPVGIRAAISVAGGIETNATSYGQSLEFIECYGTGVAQSWVNQVLAAKFARILDAHPNYNIWDARQHMRQAASLWASGWTETNGYGHVNEHAVVGKLLPGPPVEFGVARSHDRRQVIFTWRNFLQTGFAATVIARKGGPILYEGAGTNFVWTSDVDGDATFLYWSKNKAGERSRMESYQTRTVTGLNCRRNQTCLFLCANPGGESRQFEQIAPNWVCDVVYLLVGAGHDKTVASNVPLPDYSAMVTYAISNRYHILVAPVAYPDRDLYRCKDDWDRAAAAGILVVVPNHTSLMPHRRRLSPPRLSSAVTVAGGLTNSIRSFGPGLEFLDAPTGPDLTLAGSSQAEAAVVAGKLAQILDANPQYNIWDARQHLRQSASFYPTGWVEDGGYGQPPAQPARIAVLDPAPPLEIQATKAAGGTSVTFSWENFLQSSFAETVIMRKDGRTIYHGTGTNYVWRSDLNGDEAFRFFSRDKAGRLSRPESYTALLVAGLAR